MDNEPSSPIDLFLKTQQTLTAVERFSEMHEKGKIPQAEKLYKSLLPGKAPSAGQQYAFEVDLDRCSGCKACITGCHNRNGLDDGEMWRNVGLIHGENKFVPVLPLKSSEILKGNFVTDLEKEKQYRPPTECGSGSDPAPFERKPELLKLYFQQHITTACHHCMEPACLTGCPVKAYEKNPQTGIVKHLDDQCIGCQYCIYKCPYGVPQYSKARGIVRKCDMCAERLREGEAPACVQSCPNEAIRITLVDTLETSAVPGKKFQIPSAPDPSYTKPTTVYKTSRLIPETALAGDHSVTLPQPSEIPLVCMLVLTQSSVGMILLSLFTAGPQLFNRFQSTAGLFLGGLGLLIALLHLGRPLYAYRSFLGFRTSWLSREAVLFGIFMQFALAAAGFTWAPVHAPWVHPLCQWMAAVFGLAGVFSSGMIYFDTPRPGWNSKTTLIKFFLTCGILGVSETIFAEIYFKNKETNFLIPSLVLIAMVCWKSLLEARAFIYLLDKTDHPLKRSGVLLAGDLKIFSISRWLAMGLGVTFFAGVVAVPANRMWFAGLGFVLLLAGEFLERHLFFRSVVPPKMPGSVTA